MPILSKYLGRMRQTTPFLIYSFVFIVMQTEQWRGARVQNNRISFSWNGREKYWSWFLLPDVSQTSNNTAVDVKVRTLLSENNKSNVLFIVVRKTKAAQQHVTWESYLESDVWQSSKLFQINVLVATNKCFIQVSVLIINSIKNSALNIIVCLIKIAISSKCQKLEVRVIAYGQCCSNAQVYRKHWKIMFISFIFDLLDMHHWIFIDLCRVCVKKHLT